MKVTLEPILVLKNYRNAMVIKKLLNLSRKRVGNFERLEIEFVSKTKNVHLKLLRAISSTVNNATRNSNIVQSSD